MPVAACPFCFTKIDTSQLAYQCTGQGRQKCKLATDSLRMEMNGNGALSYPTFWPLAKRGQNVACPTCGGPARRRACQACHTALPSDFEGSDSPMIGIVGSKSSGKTVLMTVMVRELRKNVGRRFGAAVSIASDNPDGHESVQQYLEARENALFDHGKLPPETVASAQEARRPLLVRWQGERRGRFGGAVANTLVLSFIDTAGEDLEDLETGFTLKYLKACDGLLVALDPFAIPGAAAAIHLPETERLKAKKHDPYQVLERVTEILRVEQNVKRGKKIKTPMALAFTKIDAFFPTLQPGNPIMTRPVQQSVYDNVGGQNIHEQIRGLLASWGGTEIDLLMQHNYADYRFFGVSALGAQPDYDRNRVAPGGVQPHRVEEPLLWLLSKEGAVPTQ